MLSDPGPILCDYLGTHKGINGEMSMGGWNDDN